MKKSHSREKMRKEAVFFDLDGTLVDSLEDLKDAVNYMLAAFGMSRLESDNVRALIGKGVKNLVGRALGSESSETIEKGMRLFLSYNTAHIADKSRIYPGTIEMLEELRSAGIRMAVISNKNEALCRLITESLKIADFFETVCGGDTFDAMKPSPLPILKVLEKFKLSASASAIAGDSINDIQAGKLAGVTTFGCRWGYGYEPELSEADFRMGSWKEFSPILRLL